MRVFARGIQDALQYIQMNKGLLNQLKSLKAELAAKYHVKKLGLFGSFARGEERPDSDVDLLVEFDQPIGFFRFLELEEYLGTRLGHSVDLVSRKALKPRIGRNILREVLSV